METIRVVSLTIENYLKHEIEDESEVVAALEELDGLEINVDLLTTTHIGKTLGKLLKDKRKSPKIVSAAKSLQAKWKKIAVKSGGTKGDNKRKREESSSESPAAQKRKTNHAKEEKVPKVQPKKEEIKNEVKKDEVKKEKEEKKPQIPIHTKDFKGESSNPARSNVQMKLSQALGVCTLMGGTESSKVAINIENALFKQYGDPKNKEYLQKFRSLFSNLKDELNDGLRNALFTGALSADRLIQMSYEELANPKLQKERKDLKDYQQEARRGDRHMRDATCSMFSCHKCGQNKTTYFQLQTRSADEPMTTFVTCCNCGNNWKF